MPATRLLAAVLACATVVSASAAIDDFTIWDLFQDAATATPTQAAAMTGSAATNLAQLNFIDGVPQNAGFDVGYSSINANTVGEATSGYYFSAANDFKIAISFEFTLTNPAGFAGIGFGIGEDRAGVNSVGAAFGVGTGLISAASFGAAATNNDVPASALFSPSVNPVLSGSTYSGTMLVAYDATTGDITVGAATASGATMADSTVIFTGATDLSAWAGDDLVVSFFLRSDDPLIFNSWSGQTAEADFFDFTVIEGSATQVPEPTSLAFLALGGMMLARRRRA